MNLKRSLILPVLLLSLFPISALAQSDTSSIFKISIITAFLGGLVSFLSPCTGAVLPAFFAYTFKEKKNLIKMTFVFSLGLALMLLPLGLGATAIGSFFTLHRFQITLVGGIILILFGLIELIGINIPLPDLTKLTPKVSNNSARVFLFGLAFGTGTIPCAGPILGAILTLAATSATLANGIILMLTYTLGIVAPLFIIAYFFDKYKLGESKLLTGGEIKFKLVGIEYKLHWTKLISGIIFIGLGVLFVFFGGTSVLTNSNPFGGLDFFFDIQENIFNLNNSIPRYAGYLVITAIVLFLMYKFRDKIIKLIKK